MPRPYTMSSDLSPAYSVENFSSDEVIETVPTAWIFSGRYAPPNTPSSDYSRSPKASRHGSINLNLVHNVDLRAITYDGTVEENLICPICRCALVDPISTSCSHTFCAECINDSLSHSSTCPIDRSVLKKEMDLSPSPRIVINQLDNLRVQCPCCQALVPRSMIENHMSKYCLESLMRCPGINTNKKCPHKVKRKLENQGCLHYFTECPDCEETVVQIGMDEHRESSCRARNLTCEDCGVKILRCKALEHARECPDTIAPCRWADYGCHHRTHRKELGMHHDVCNFRMVGSMAEILKKEIGELRSEVRTLTDTNQLQERRIKFLENGNRQFERTMDYCEISGPSLPSLPEPDPGPDGGALDSSHEYLLSLLESQESKLSQLAAGMTELEAKQTTMLFNETIPIKNELAEIRSLQQTTGMHVRWLMAFRIRENNRRVNTGPAPNPGPAANTDPCEATSDSIFSRRSSDTLSRDIITKL